MKRTTLRNRRFSKPKKLPHAREFTRRHVVPLAFILIFAAIGLVATFLARAATTNTSSSTSNSGVPPLYLGLSAYANLDKLSYLEIGDRIDSQSTADPGGSNAIINKNGTLFDQIGPGVDTFMRMQNTRGGPWTLNVDGSQTTVNFSDLGQSNPSGQPASLFPYPLSLNTNQSHGSSIIATTVPFSHELKFTSASQNGNFYSIYRKLPVGTALPTYGDSSLTSQAKALLNAAGSDIAPTNIPSKSGSVTLGAAGQPTTLATLSGSSQIRALKIQVPFSKKVQLGNSTLQIYWDGEASPSVNAPIKFLAGDGAGVYQPSGRQLVQGLLANTTSDGSTYFSFNLYYPMPFASSARIVIVPNSASAGLTGVSWSARYESFTAPSNWWAHFHANYVSIPHPQSQQDMTFLDYSGSGKLVGTVVNFGAVGSTLEGNPDIYVDGSQTPQIAITGTEEWGLGGDYWNGGQQVSLAMGGLPSATNNPSGSDIEGAAEYRYLVADSIPFNNKIVVDWEHGGVNQSTLPYSATMLWYGTPNQTAVQSDEIVTGSASSTSAHGYSSPGSTKYSLTAAYEYLPYAPLITGTVAKMSTSATFSMQLNPSNAGAFLRRTLDSCVANQEATVYVNGQNAGTWYNPGVSPKTGYDGHNRCWRDGDFPLPASMTANKRSITIKLTSASWTASDYKLFSFVPVGASSQPPPPPSPSPSPTPSPNPSPGSGGGQGGSGGGASSALPSTPANLTARAMSGTQVNLTWAAGNDSPTGDITGYDVMRDGVNVGYVTPSASLSFGDTGLKPSTKYTYKVAALGSDGLTADSNSVSVTTLSSGSTGSITSPVLNGTTSVGAGIQPDSSSASSHGSSAKRLVADTMTSLVWLGMAGAIVWVWLWWGRYQRLSQDYDYDLDRWRQKDIMPPSGGSSL